MASTREIKRRIRGINSILQITKAMELVSTAKLRRARIRLAKTKPYYQTVVDDIREILSVVDENHSLLVREKKDAVLYIVLTSDKGLAGGYNANVLRLTEKTIKEDGCPSKLLVVGTKARDYFERRNYDIAESYTGLSEDPEYSDARELAAVAMDLYKKGKVDAIRIIYTRFISTISYDAQVVSILPSDELKAEEDLPAVRSQIEFEPSPMAVLDYLIPMYVATAIFGSLIEAAASEQGSRRVAMENASDNAHDMIDELQTNYNRARQAAITNEITEIVSAADAVQ
ncbi:ATP synthase F1 subunit gamma [Aedoeadaptatus urinae]|uniref:ATP synthase F1 subunit gamma n=1 Tax=Aedoeadaptatus urinae TaxID=1871017 RepID=UPI00097D95D5|nr:ATP synthase F1 subunit gamma [Peptoniphilus urinae]